MLAQAASTTLRISPATPPSVGQHEAKRSRQAHATNAFSVHFRHAPSSGDDPRITKSITRLILIGVF
ncbi:hypothetical protein, partial [Mesorhizobium sp. M2A.F.Ca.ET.067.02.1.1]|uniref:hypothetical protein n=1 Tax=Mesorhizobium sp. M2A.F.Ca.ET.067.02.1.1 TaxID=2496749 RepID=UPI001AEC8DA9